MDQLSTNNNLNLPEDGDETKIVDVTFQYIVIRLGEEQYGLVWEDGLWVRNNASELGGPTGACTIEYPAHSAKACYADYDGKPVFDSAKFREDCVRMFKDLEKDFSKSSWSLSGRPFKIMVEDAGLDNRGVQDYCVYLLYN